MTVTYNRLRRRSMCILYTLVNFRMRSLNGCDKMRASISNILNSQSLHVRIQKTEFGQYIPRLLVFQHENISASF